MELPATSPREDGPAADALAAKLGALSHPARIEILRHLSSAGRCCCKDVVDTLDLAQSTVSQHLKVLVSAGLVLYAPDRQRSVYAVDRDALASLSRTVSGLLDSCCSGELHCVSPGQGGETKE